MGFARATSPREFAFARDHGSHPGYKTEWWYLTGALRTETGELIGYQATWFRSAIVAEPPRRDSQLAARDLYFFHGAVTDVARDTFVFDQLGTRGASTWAGAREDGLGVHVFDRKLEPGPDGSWRLRVRVREHELDLRLRPTRGPLLHGEEPGLSRKGPEVGQASYYYSHTRIETRGTLHRAGEPEPVRVEGSTWFDHEFGSSQLSENHVGWDWFSVALDDGTDLMLYVIRRDDGSVEPRSSGTIRGPDGQRRHIDSSGFRVEPLGQWSSPASGGTYPARWRLAMPGHDVSLVVRPVLPDQELRTTTTTGVTYWEGLCSFEGRIGSRAVAGHGYVELVGYAGRFLHGI